MYDVVKPLCENFVLEIKELLNILNKHDLLSLYFVFSFILSGGVGNNYMFGPILCIFELLDLYYILCGLL